MHSGFSNYLAICFPFVLHTALYLPSLREEQASCLQPGHSLRGVFWGHWGSRGTGRLGRQGAWLTVQAGSELWWLVSPRSAPSYAHGAVPAGTLGVLLQTLVSRLYQEEQVFQAPLTVLLGVHPPPGTANAGVSHPHPDPDPHQTSDRC